jgi:hypothetical protein
MSDPTYPQPPADHSVKVPHLVFGLLVLGVAGIWALGASDAISGESLAVLGPGVLIVAGVIGLAASLANGRNRRRSAAAGYTPQTHDTAEYTDTSDTTDTTDTSDYAADDGDEHTKEIR